MISRGGSVRASGTARASSWLSAAAFCGATRIEPPVGSGASSTRSSALAASSSSGGAPKELCGSISRSSGPAMNVVTSAMIDERREQRRRDDAHREGQIEHDQLGQPARVHERAERRRLAPRQPHDARGDHGAAVLADDRDRDQAEHDQDERPASELGDVGAQARVGEEQRQQEDEHEVLDAARDVLGQARVAGHDGAHHEAAEDDRDPDLVGRDRRQQDAGEDRRDPQPGHAAELVVGDGRAREQRADRERPSRRGTGSPSRSCGTRSAPCRRRRRPTRARSGTRPTRHRPRPPTPPARRAGA